jgi:hypothetical protein
MDMRSGMLVAGIVLGFATAAAAQSTPSTMPADSWLVAPNTAMRAVAPTNGQFAGTWGTSGPASVIVAWGGAALDTQRSRLVLFGGGHSDYWGNEVYAFDIASLAWSRLTDPTVNPTLNNDVNWDGTPNSRHTYSGLAYIAHADRFFALGGSIAGNGFAATQNTWTFDFNSKTWSNMNPSPTPGGGLGENCSYDPATKKVWWCSAKTSFAGLWSYEYDTNTWTKQNSDNFYYFTSTVDTNRGVFVVVGNGEVFSYDLKNGNYTKNVWATTGGDSFIAQGNVGLDYDPTTDKIVGWRGGSPYILDPVTKAWTVGTSTGAPSQGMNGIYGRWRYVPSVNAFVVVTGIDDNVYFYKMSAGGGSPPPAPPPPVPPPPAPAPPNPAPSSGSSGGSHKTCGCGSVSGEVPWVALVLGAVVLYFSRRTRNETPEPHS